MPDDYFIEGLAHRLPAHVLHSFTDEQLSALQVAFGARAWEKHPVDLRGTVGFWHWRYYFVLLSGRHRRRLSRIEAGLSRWAVASTIGTFLFVSFLVGLLVLYVLKSALGIDLLPDTSLGIWDRLKRVF
jgi:hypothetical protein